MDPASDIPEFTIFGAILIPTLISILALLLLYGVIRVAVTRALRDHQLWMERNRPTYNEPPRF